MNPIQRICESMDKDKRILSIKYSKEKDVYFVSITKRSWTGGNFESIPIGGFPLVYDRGGYLIQRDRMEYARYIKNANDLDLTPYLRSEDVDVIEKFKSTIQNMRK